MDRNEYEKMYETNFVKSNEFELGICCLEEEYMQESDEYKQVFSCAKNYLKNEDLYGSNNKDSNYYVLNHFNEYVQRNQKEGIVNSWGSFASVFLLLTWYSLRILRAPWRKSYGKIKTFTGHFQHSIYSNFPHSIVEELMLRMGYIYHRQTFLFQSQSLLTSGNWREPLMQAGMDFFLVHVRCSLSSTQTGRSMPVQDILSSSRNAMNVDMLTSPLKNSTLFHSESNLSMKSHSSDIRSHQSLSKRHSSPVVPKKPHSMSTASSSNATTLPSKSKRTSRPLDADWPRVEVIPNEYVSSHMLSKHGQRKPAVKGESSRPSIPWEHRLANPLKKSPSYAYRKANHRSEFSDDSDDMPLYEGNSTDAFLDSTIRYPPQNLTLRTSAANDAALRAALSTSDYPPKARKGVKSNRNTLGKETNSRSSSDNYVTAMPIIGHAQSSKILHPSRERVESGYYSERATSSGMPSSMSSKFIQGNQDYGRITSPTFAGAVDKFGRSSGYRNLKFNASSSAGEYVQAYPTKRPPGDGRSEPLSPHIYQEIPDAQWNTSQAGNTSTNSKIQW